MQLQTVSLMVIVLGAGADALVLLVAALLPLILETLFRLFSLLLELPIFPKENLTTCVHGARRKVTSSEIVPLCLQKCGSISRKKLSDAELKVLADHAGNPNPCILALAVPADCKHVSGRWELIFDTGADYHVVGNRDLLIEMRQANKQLRTAANSKLDVIGMGTLHACLGGYQDRYGVTHPIDIEIPNVLYAPECPYNLLSVHLLWHYNIFLNCEERMIYMPGFSDQNNNASFKVWGQRVQMRRDKRTKQPITCFTMVLKSLFSSVMLLTLVPTGTNQTLFWPLGARNTRLHMALSATTVPTQACFM